MIDAVRKRRRNRLLIIGGAGVLLSLALTAVLFALNEQITFFQSPTDIVEKAIQPGERMRLGGLVEEGSVKRTGDVANFAVTDGANSINVVFNGILPDLFREGQGIIAEGALATGGVFKAETVLAKHDENYIPKEVADSLKKQGVWKGAGNDG